MEKIRKYILVDGIVQGVGFRWFTRYQALECHLTGWVRNRPDGRVEMEVQGFERDVDAFTGRLFRGNRFIKIMDYEEKQLDVRSELGFRIRG